MSRSLYLTRMKLFAMFATLSALATASPVITGGSILVTSGTQGTNISVSLTGPGLNLSFGDGSTTYGIQVPAGCSATCSYNFTQTLSTPTVSGISPLVDGFQYGSGTVTRVQLTLSGSSVSATPTVGSPQFNTAWGSTAFTASGTLTLIDPSLAPGSNVIYTGTFSGSGTATAASQLIPSNLTQGQVTYTFANSGVGVPEPGAAQLLTAGFVGAFGWMRFRKRAAVRAA